MKSKTLMALAESAAGEYMEHSEFSQVHQKSELHTFYSWDMSFKTGLTFNDAGTYLYLVYDENKIARVKGYGSTAPIGKDYIKHITLADLNRYAEAYGLSKYVFGEISIIEDLGEIAMANFLKDLAAAGCKDLIGYLPVTTAASLDRTECERSFVFCSEEFLNLVIGFDEDNVEETIDLMAKRRVLNVYSEQLNEGHFFPNDDVSLLTYITVKHSEYYYNTIGCLIIDALKNLNPDLTFESGISEIATDFLVDEILKETHIVYFDKILEQVYFDVSAVIHRG